MTPKEARSGITQEEVQNLFHYDPETGIVTRRFTRGRHDRWKAGDRVGFVTKRGYRCIGLGTNRPFQEHRIIWLYMTGSWPELEIDHINGDGTDNRWCNLRQATRANNLHNTKRHHDGASGIKGVIRIGNAWVARLKRPDGSSYSKSFQLKDDAAKAYEQEARRVFGEFARVA